METTGRYFAASVLGGRLYPQGLSRHEGWNPRRLVYRSEAEVGLTFNPRVGDRTIRTVEELREALRASAERPLPSVTVWMILEGLEGEARKAWERS